ncbi:MAG TPA: DUF3576 domain-containing protein [Kiloniellaceae bacterium]|nr:DUF3576 domain-containing protein [Kiloniellaceae bacterium]
MVRPFLQTDLTRLSRKNEGRRKLRRAPTIFSRLLVAPLLGVGLLGLAACGDYSGDGKTVYPEDDNRKNNSTTGLYAEPGSIFGKDGLSIGNGPDTGPEGGGTGGGIGVNTYLWRASLDTISFMPLASADPFGGVIITDWYSPPETQDERFKINLFILGRDLRADGVRATVFRQLADGTGSWIDAPVEQQTPIDLENAILTRARQLRITALQ